VGARPAAQLLPGLTVDQAAASRETLIAVIVIVIVAVAGGNGVITSLLVTLRLSVAGRLGDDSADGGSVDPRHGPGLSRVPDPRHSRRSSGAGRHRSPRRTRVTRECSRLMDQLAGNWLERGHD